MDRRRLPHDRLPLRGCRGLGLFGRVGGARGADGGPGRLPAVPLLHAEQRRGQGQDGGPI